MSDISESTTSDLGGETMRLLSGLCHEMGNVLTATRLYAQFLTDEIGPEEVAENAGELDHLSGVASQLLLLVRPIVAPLERGRGVAEPRDVLERVQASLEPTRKGVEVGIAFDSSAGVSRVNMDGDLLQTFIATLIQEACQGLPEAGRVDVRVEASSGPVVFVVEDDGEEDEGLVRFREEALRGRPLRCAIIDHVLRKFGGRVEASRKGLLTRVELQIPTS
jgi:signal transduction histidine kinase